MMVMRLSYLYHGDPYTGKTFFVVFNQDGQPPNPDSSI